MDLYQFVPQRVLGPGGEEEIPGRNEHLREDVGRSEADGAFRVVLDEVEEGPGMGLRTVLATLAALGSLWKQGCPVNVEQLRSRLGRMQGG